MYANAHAGRVPYFAANGRSVQSAGAIALSADRDVTEQQNVMQDALIAGGRVYLPGGDPHHPPVD